MENKDKSTVERNADGALVVAFDCTIFSIDAVKKAAYKFAKHCSISISKSDSELFVTLSNFSDSSEVGQQRLAGALCNEVIDQDLRETIYAKTEGLRNVILAQAFSQTSLLDS